MKENKKIKEKYYKDEHVTLGEHNSGNVEKLYELYEKDKFKARVYYMNEKLGFTNSKLILFMNKNGDFDIVNFNRTYGISKTNIIYSREKRTFQLKFSKRKFALILNNRATCPTFQQIVIGSCQVEHQLNLEKTIIATLSERFSWLRFVKEYRSIHNISLNTFVNKKLFSLKKALTYQYKCPYPVAKKINESKVYSRAIDFVKYYTDYLSNIESLKSSWVNEHFDLFYDTLKLAKIVDKKVNASWSFRRLKEEHDKWSEIINNIMFLDCSREIKIDPIFEGFAEKSNCSLIETTKDLAEEGLRMNHCVSSYISDIERGVCGIYNFKKHTIELRKKKLEGVRVLYISQIVTYGNKKADEIVLKEVLVDINNFNTIKGVKTPVDKLNEILYEEFPF